MSLPHILLGMLDQPAAGYDLKKHFEESVGHFWAARLSQIYPALAKLEDQGLLSSRMEPSDRGPDRKVYRRTAAGTEALQAWLEEGPVMNEERLAWLAQVYLLDGLPDDESRLVFLKDMRDQLAEEHAYLVAADQAWRDNDPRYPDALPDELFFKSMALDLGVHKLAAKLEWSERCIARLEARMAGTARRSS